MTTKPGDKPILCTWTNAKSARRKGFNNVLEAASQLATPGGLMATSTVIRCR